MPHGWMARRRWVRTRSATHERATAVLRHHVARTAHSHVAHGDGAADRRRARRPGRGGNHAQSRPHALDRSPVVGPCTNRSEEHTSELQSQSNLVCRLLLEKKKKKNINASYSKISSR